MPVRGLVLVGLVLLATLFLQPALQLILNLELAILDLFGVARLIPQSSIVTPLIVYAFKLDILIYFILFGTSSKPTS